MNGLNRDDIIRMAREAGWYEAQSHDDCPACGVFDLYRFANLVAAAEREACALLCDAEANRVRDLHNRLDDGCIDALLGKELSARKLASVIRERGAP
jgi:hypothetical protein